MDKELSAAGNDINNDSDSIIFTIKDTKLFAQKLSKLFNKWFERSVYLSVYKIKSENKNMANKYIFSNQNLLESIDYLF